MTVAAPVGTGRLLAADSWLVEDGRVRALGRHLDRFRAACAVRGGVTTDELERFLTGCTAEIPGTGRWFPRVELRPAGLGLLVREAPPRRTRIGLWVDESGDRRAFPGLKGPDLDLLAAVRERAIEAGADEAVLVAADRTVLEGSTTSLLWWRGGTLCAPPPEAAILPGVTRALILSEARRRGIPIRYELCRPAGLDGLEVWAVNALHGIRPVSTWLSCGITPGPALHAPAWDAWLTRHSDERRDRR
jgi:branched-subunit amino acid aminotransferase/4-amino-4-deoxychorismate lyase